MANRSTNSEGSTQYFNSGELRSVVRSIACVECREELIPLPATFKLQEPHPYASLGAPYGAHSPFNLRSGVVERLLAAREHLRSLKPEYNFLIWDGYRPLEVQHYMVEHTLAQLADERGLDVAALIPEQREELLSIVFQVWARPDPDPDMPPPHSTGAAVDLTIIDEQGRPLDMGSEIDAFPPLCLPNHYADKTSPEDRLRHSNRELLLSVMNSAGFARLPHEWWHFSYGDKMWAYLRTNGNNPEKGPTALYGRYAVMKM